MTSLTGSYLTNWLLQILSFLSKSKNSFKVVSFSFSKSSKRFVQFNYIMNFSNLLTRILHYFSIKYTSTFDTVPTINSLQQIIFFFSFQSELSKTEEMQEAGEGRWRTPKILPHHQFEGRTRPRDFNPPPKMKQTTGVLPSATQQILNFQKKPQKIHDHSHGIRFLADLKIIGFTDIKTLRKNFLKNQKSNMI